MSFLEDLKKPFSEIKKDPYNFIKWFFVAFIIGSIAIWIPLFINKISNKTFIYYIGTNIATFNIVILSERLAETISTVGGSNSKKTAGIRSLFSAVAILLIIVNAFFSFFPITSYVLNIVTLIVILLASYMYCFKSADWEENADKIVKQENDDVSELSKKAGNVKSYDKGVRL